MSASGAHQDVRERHMNTTIGKSRIPTTLKVLFLSKVLLVSRSPALGEAVASDPKSRLVDVPGSKVAATDITKSEVFDGSGMCSNPKWKASKIDKRMIAWKGPELAFLTLASHQGQFDDNVIKSLVARLHRGWAAYAYVMRDKPRKGKNYQGAAAMVAIPRKQAVAIGQGWIGHQGIDVATFYDKGYEMATKGDVEWYYFYEMGRCWFTGAVWKKFAYDSAFAVHMGTVAQAYAMERPRPHNSKLLAKSRAASFNFSKLIAYDRATTKALGSDFNGFYNEMLLKLSGGDLRWVKSYYHHLLETANHGGNRNIQILNWIVASCAASETDVSPQFVETLQVPLSEHAKQRFSEIDWENPYSVAYFYRPGFEVNKCFAPQTKR